MRNDSTTVSLRRWWKSLKLGSIFSKRVLKSATLSRIYAFGPFRFDTEQRLLLVDGRIAALTPKALALLALLIQHHGRVVEKQAIMQALWPGIAVDEGNLTQSIWMLRKVLGDGVIETVPRRGYRFIADLRQVPPDGSTRRWWIGTGCVAGVAAVIGWRILHARAQADALRGEAHDLCVKGRASLWDQRTPDGVQRAMGYFERAKALDPKCASAWAGLADCYSMGIWSHVTLLPREAMPKAKSAAERALHLDPKLAQAHSALALVKFRYDWDWAGAEREYREALRLNPRDANAHWSYGVFLATLGRAEEAIAEIDRAQQLDPLSPFIRLVTGFAFNVMRRSDQAIEAYRKALQLDPNYVQGHQYLSRAYMGKRMYPEAVAEAIKGARSSVQAAALREGYKTDGLRGFLQAQRKFDNPANGSWEMASQAVRLGQVDDCFRWLDQAYKERNPHMPLIATHQNFDPVRTDPRFAALLARMGLPAYRPATR